MWSPIIRVSKVVTWAATVVARIHHKFRQDSPLKKSLKDRKCDADVFGGPFVLNGEPFRMQNTSSPSPTWANLRFNVWGLATASAVTVLVAGLVKLLFHVMHGPRQPLSGLPGAQPPPEMMTHYSSFGEWHLFAVVIHAVLAGVAAAIFAAVYNAVSFKRTP